MGLSEERYNIRKACPSLLIVQFLHWIDGYFMDIQSCGVGATDTSVTFILTRDVSVSSLQCAGPPAGAPALSCELLLKLSNRSTYIINAKYLDGCMKHY